MSPTLKHALSPKAFLIAVGGACLVYAGLTLSTVFKGPHILDALEAKMAVQSIPFERAEAPVTEILVSESMALTEADRVTDEDLMIEQTGLNASLPPAPFEGLTEESPLGDLPTIGKNKLKPFDAYKKPFVLDVKKSAIGIGVVGLGFSSSTTSKALEVLSSNVSLILSPYADNVDALQKEVRKRGFETWMTLPLETKKFPKTDPGSLSILVDGGLRFNQDNLRRVLSSTQGYAGIATYTDASFMDLKPMLDGILSDVMIRGLGFLEMNPQQDALSEALAISNRVPYAHASIKKREERLNVVFTRLKKTAKTNQRAVGVISLSPAMLKAYKAEISKAQKEGFQIVPLSALADSY